jgi:hypothetical protein
MEPSSQHTGHNEITRLLDEALRAGHIKPETCINAATWLADSFAEV